jgi:hypothetical protein
VVENSGASGPCHLPAQAFEMSIKEQLEYVASYGYPVTAVRPIFGTQSDSFRGQLSNCGNGVFNLQCEAITILFSLDDVKTTETFPCDGPGVYVQVIRLKGQSDYSENKS